MEICQGFLSNTGQKYIKKKKATTQFFLIWVHGIELLHKIVLCFFFSICYYSLWGYFKRCVLLLLFLQAVPNQQRIGQPAPGSRSPPLPTDYLVEINKVLLSMDDAELSLNAPELSTVVYEDFSFQEDSLKVNLQAPRLNSHSYCRNKARNLSLCFCRWL